MPGMRRSLRFQRVQRYGHRGEQTTGGRIGYRLQASGFSFRNAIPASAEKSFAANSLVRNFGYAAAAIIAALSVESWRDGKYTGSPSCAACRSNVCRSSLLAATPPVTNNVATSY